MEGLRITHTIFKTQLKCVLDLRHIALHVCNVEYRTAPFKRLTWRHKSIGGTCLIYSSGSVIMHGSTTQLRAYCRKIQKLGYDIHYSGCTIVTKCASYRVRNLPIYYERIVQTLGGSYQPEIFHGVEVRRKNICFLIYNTGTVLISGIKRDQDLDNVVVPFLVELEIL